MSSKRVVKFVAILIGLGILIAAVVSALWYREFDQWSKTPFNISETQFVELQSGQTLSSFAQELVPLGLIEEPKHLVWLARREQLGQRLQAGEYAVEPGVTPLNLLHKLAYGDIVLHSIRIEEGITVQQMLATLAADTRIKHELSATNIELLVDQLDSTKNANLEAPLPYAEGMFFPDTYFVERGDTDVSILQRARRAMVSQLAEVWAQRSPGIAIETPEEALILASIIEKETGLAEDRFAISQVFHNRLRKGMRLQTDPTVIYGLGDSFDGNLTRAHLRAPSTHNTYVIKGLPPTPIALPSIQSLQAAVHPSQGNFYYFVARGDGSSEFSETLQQHNAAVRKYQLKK